MLHVYDLRKSRPLKQVVLLFPESRSTNKYPCQSGVAIPSTVSFLFVRIKSDIKN